MEKLLDIVHFLYLETRTAFGSSAIVDGDKPVKNHLQKLGSTGLALHNATIITQIDTLRTLPQIKGEMEKTLRWLVPMATNTTKSELSRKPVDLPNLLRIETLHANKEATFRITTSATVLELNYATKIMNKIKLVGNPTKV